jgi:hypothetical protein
MQFINPAPKNVSGVSTKKLCEFEETWTWLHISCLVNDDNGQHALSGSVFFSRYLP